MSKKIIFASILLIVIGVLLMTIWLYYQLGKKDASYSPSSFPPSSTQKEIDEAKKLPREECPCWIGGNNPDAFCAPAEWCI